MTSHGGAAPTQEPSQTSPSHRAFRNVVGNTSDPVDSWPVVALSDTITTGLIGDWKPIIEEISRRPWGKVARRVENICSAVLDDRAAVFFSLLVERSRQRAGEREEKEVANRIRDSLMRSGLTQAEFARHIGTSASRLSTYLSGQVTPSAAMLIRIESTAADLNHESDSTFTAGAHEE